MAYVAAATPFFMTVLLVDNGNNKTLKTYDLQGADLAAATANAGIVLTALAAVSDAAIKGYNIGSRFVNDAFVFPASGVHIEDVALLTLSLTGDPTKYATTAIPAPKSTMFQGTSGAAANNVKADKAEIIAYWELFKSASEAYLSDGETAAIYVAGKRIHRGSNRG